MLVWFVSPCFNPRGWLGVEDQHAAGLFSLSFFLLDLRLPKVGSEDVLAGREVLGGRKESELYAVGFFAINSLSLY